MAREMTACWNRSLLSALKGGSKPCSLNSSSQVTGASVAALMDVLASPYLLSSMAAMEVSRS